MLASLGALAAQAQTGVSLGAGVGTVRSETGSSFSSASLSPAVWYTTPAVALGAWGSIASLPTGVWATSGRAYLRGTTPRVAGRWRLATEGMLLGTKWSSGAWTAAAHGLGEVLWSTPGWGFGLGAGPSTGWIAHDVAPRFVALHTRARAWWRPRRGTDGSEWQLSVEPTRFFGAWFTDVSAGLTVRRRQGVLSLSTDGRLSAAYGSTGAASASLQWFVSPAVSLEVSGGSYLREPYQGFPRGGFFAAGIRLGSTRASRAATGRKWGPLIPERRGDSVTVRFRFGSVRSVAIAGDWDGWKTHALRAAGGDLWEGTFVLAPGLYHFNLLVDGRNWVVPSGVATVPDEAGGIVALLLVR